MSSKEDLLKQLSVKKLREFAQDNRILLVYEIGLKNVQLKQKMK